MFGLGVIELIVIVGILGVMAGTVAIVLWLVLRDS